MSRKRSRFRVISRWNQASVSGSFHVGQDLANNHAAGEWAEGVRRLVGAWVNDRNENTKPADWRFTTQDARIKLKRLYPNLSS